MLMLFAVCLTSLSEGFGFNDNTKRSEIQVCIIYFSVVEVPGLSILRKIEKLKNVESIFSKTLSLH